MNWELSELTWKVRELAVETGAFIREERKKFSRERIEKKHAHDYVSYVDKESERRIVACLREWLPEAGFIAEEGSGSHADEEYCWVVDPLDGTTNFIHNHAPYCISIALRNREEILLGVVTSASGLTRERLLSATTGRYGFRRWLRPTMLFWLLGCRMMRMSTSRCSTA